MKLSGVEVPTHDRFCGIKQEEEDEEEEEEEEFCFIPSVFQTMHTLHPCQITQNQYKYKNHSKHGNNI